MKIILLPFYFLLTYAAAQPDTTLAIGKCAACDTVYRHGAIRRIECFYADASGNRTSELYSMQRFRRGVPHGLEQGFYRKQEALDVNVFGKPFRKPPSFFDRIVPEFILAISPVDERYIAYWKHGQPQSRTYYDTLQKVVSDTLYAVFDGWWSSRLDLKEDGTQSHVIESDTMVVYTVRNHVLDGELLQYNRKHMLTKRFFFSNGQLIWGELYRHAVLRKKFVYSNSPVPREMAWYDKTGTLKRRKKLRDKYSYREMNYETVYKR